MSRIEEKNHDQKGQIIDLDDYRRIWITRHVESKCCGYRWQAVYVAFSEKLQCPKCMEINEFKILGD